MQTQPLDPRPTTDEAWARDRLAGWFDAAGITPAWPASTETVAKLMHAAEYAVDSPDVILHYLQAGFCPQPQRIGGRYTWSACDVVNLARAAEYRRAWQPGSQLHAPKKTPVEVAAESAAANGLPSVFHDIDDVSLDDILFHLTECGDLALRRAMLQAARDKIRIEAER